MVHKGKDQIKKTMGKTKFFQTIEEFNGNLYKGVGIKRMKGYKCYLILFTNKSIKWMAWKILDGEKRRLKFENNSTNYESSIKKGRTWL